MASSCVSFARTCASSFGSIRLGLVLNQWGDKSQQNSEAAPVSSSCPAPALVGEHRKFSTKVSFSRRCLRHTRSYNSLFDIVCELCLLFYLVHVVHFVWLLYFFAHIHFLLSLYLSFLFSQILLLLSVFVRLTYRPKLMIPCFGCCTQQLRGVQGLPLSRKVSSSRFTSLSTR